LGSLFSTWLFTSQHEPEGPQAAADEDEAMNTERLIAFVRGDAKVGMIRSRYEVQP
jgi:hypothetical protein